MSQNNILIGVLIEESKVSSSVEICQKYNIPEKLLMELVEYGLFSNQPTQAEQIALNQKELQRIEAAFRLHQDLGINLPGVVLAIELLDKIKQMDEELDILRKHF